ncbi:MAG TPA: hypothetical protein VIO35_04125 [Chloroflexota bacterium]
MYSRFEWFVISRFNRAVPRLDHDQRDQFANTLPILALLSVVLAGLLGGWLTFLVFVVQAVMATPDVLGALIITPLFWIELLPPILWALSFVPLQRRRLAGWRLFVAGTFLSLIGSLVSLNLISILFSAAILYVTLQCYDEFNRGYF